LTYIVTPILQVHAKYLSSALRQRNLAVQAHHHILKLARLIPDLTWVEEILSVCLTDAQLDALR